jgi:hypothetical protein
LGYSFSIVLGFPLWNYIDLDAYFDYIQAVGALCPIRESELGFLETGGKRAAPSR